MRLEKSCGAHGRMGCCVLALMLSGAHLLSGQAVSVLLLVGHFVYYGGWARVHKVSRVARRSLA